MKQSSNRKNEAGQQQEKSREGEKWNEYYSELEDSLHIIPSGCQVDRISHIGSTAIDGIWAKNIIDVLVEVPQSENIGNVANIMKQSGFIIMSADTKRISLNKGYTKEGFADKVYHIHLRYTGDNEELYFRDYLNEHPDVAKEYETLKLKLWKNYKHNRDAYTEAKTEFVRKWTQQALGEYKERK